MAARPLQRRTSPRRPSSRSRRLLLLHRQRLRNPQRPNRWRPALHPRNLLLRPLLLGPSPRQPSPPLRPLHPARLHHPLPLPAQRQQPSRLLSRLRSPRPNRRPALPPAVQRPRQRLRHVPQRPSPQPSPRPVLLQAAPQPRPRADRHRPSCPRPPQARVPRRPASQLRLCRVLRQEAPSVLAPPRAPRQAVAARSSLAVLRAARAEPVLRHPPAARP